VEITKGTAEPDFRAGLALLVLAILIGFIGGRWRGPASLSVGMQLSLDMLAVVTWWIGSFVCCFGNRVSRMYVFPLCFLLFLVPLPEFALTHVVSFLQRGSAYAAKLLFAIAGIPVTQDGLRLTIPGLTLEVAEECSSIRSSLMLLVTTMVLAQLVLRSAWGKGVVILAAIPLSIAKNGFRIFTLSMLAVYVDPSFLHGWLHHQGRDSVLPGISGRLVRPTLARKVGRAQTDGSAGDHAIRTSAQTVPLACVIAISPNTSG